MLLTPPQQYDGGGTVGVEELVPYMKYGYIPQGMGRPSNTMEYAYDDWCLAQMANHLGHTDDYNYFLKRSANWTNLFDTETGFIRLKIRMAIGFLLLTLSYAGFTEGECL